MYVGAGNQGASHDDYMNIMQLSSLIASPPLILSHKLGEMWREGGSLGGGVEWSGEEPLGECLVILVNRTARPD